MEMRKYIPSSIKNFLKKIINEKYKEEELEKSRLQKLPRYQETETLLLGKKIKIADSASYNFSKIEIFEQEIYCFKSITDKPLILDCGANVGLSVIYFKTIYPNAEIWAFEPDKTIFKILEYNIESLKYENITLINKAVWDCETTLNFHSEGADAGKIIKTSEISDTIKIETVDLASYLANPIDFLKIDIEGAELVVLENCKHLLHNVQNLFVEYHSYVGQVQELDKLLLILKNAGFRYAIQQHGIVSKRPFIERENQMDMDILLNISAFRN